MWCSAHMKGLGETPSLDGMARVKSFLSKISILLISATFPFYKAHFLLLEILYEKYKAPF